MAVRKGVTVHLRLDLDLADVLPAFEPGHVDLQVEVADVADDRVVGHPLHVLAADDVAAAGRRDEDVPVGAAASSMVVTSNPSIAACRALIGSISVTITRAP